RSSDVTGISGQIKIKATLCRDLGERAGSAQCLYLAFQIFSEQRNAQSTFVIKVKLNTYVVAFCFGRLKERVGTSNSHVGAGYVDRSVRLDRTEASTRDTFRVSQTNDHVFDRLKRQVS